MTTFLNICAPLELNTGESVDLIKVFPFLMHPEFEVLTVRVRDQDHNFYSTGRPFASTMLRLGADVRLQNRVEQVRPDYRQPGESLDDYMRRWYADGKRPLYSDKCLPLADADATLADINQAVESRTISPPEAVRMILSIARSLGLSVTSLVGSAAAPEPVDADTLAVRKLMYDQMLNWSPCEWHSIPNMDDSRVEGSREHLLRACDNGELDSTEVFNITMAAYRAGRDAECRDRADRMEAMTATPAVPDRLTITIDGPQGCGKTLLANHLKGWIAHGGWSAGESFIPVNGDTDHRFVGQSAFFNAVDRDLGVDIIDMSADPQAMAA